ncbi:MAG: DUF6268 family outer membrane beta-barrel protein [Candidatus Omnitrophica bacterium]|nr:DUF6268 family outer membrane beta-barrel protein [Candidatus Omnitrophota bacterium]
MFMEKAGRVKFLVLALLCVFASAFIANVYADDGKAWAQEEAFRQAQEPNLVPIESYRQELGKAVIVAEEAYAQEWDTRARFYPASRAKNQSGKVGLASVASEYSYQVKAFGKIPVEFAIGSKYITINNSTAVKLPTQLTTVSFGAEATFPFFNFDKTYFTIGLAPSFYTDNWNFRSESFHLNQRYFMIYQPDEKWTFVLGAQYEPGSKPAVSPIAGLIYRPNDQLTFNIIPSNPEISYALNKKWTVFAEGAWVAEEYKVNQGEFNKNAVLNYNEIRTGAGIRYALNKYIESSFSLGGVFNRAIEYRQDSLGKVALKNGFYTEFRLDIVM